MKKKILLLLLGTITLMSACGGNDTTNKLPSIPTSESCSTNVSSSTSSTSTNSSISNKETTSTPISTSNAINSNTNSSSSTSQNISSTTTSSPISSSSSSSSQTPDIDIPEVNYWLTDNIQSSLPKQKAVEPTSITVIEENGKYIIAFAGINEDTSQPYKVYVYNESGALVTGFPKIITNGGMISHFPVAGTYTIKIKTPGDYVNTQDSDFSTGTKTIIETSPTGVNEPEIDYGDPLLTATHLTSPIGLEIISNVTGINGHVVAFSEASVSNASYFKAYATDNKGNLVQGFPRTIKAGDSIPYFSVNGTYYVYVQAIGDDINYKNSPLSNGVIVNETNGTGVIPPEAVQENPEKTATALSSPVGFVVNKIDDVTTHLVVAWAVDSNASSYLVYISTANGTLLAGYPSQIEVGGRIEIPEDGTYYVYIQAIGDGIIYSNSPLSSAVKLDIVNGAWGDTPSTPVVPSNPVEPDEPNNPTDPIEPEDPNIGEATPVIVTARYDGGDLVFIDFASISGLTKDNIENFTMSVKNQNGIDVLNNGMFNFNPPIVWAVQLKSAGHSELTIDFSFTYNGVNYIGHCIASV